MSAPAFPFSSVLSSCSGWLPLQWCLCLLFLSLFLLFLFQLFPILLLYYFHNRYITTIHFSLWILGRISRIFFLFMRRGTNLYFYYTLSTYFSYWLPPYISYSHCRMSFCLHTQGSQVSPAGRHHVLLPDNCQCPARSTSSHVFLTPCLPLHKIEETLKS